MTNRGYRAGPDRGPRRAAANRWIAVCCTAVGVWLLVIAVLYRDWPALAVALAAMCFGVAGLRGTANGRADSGRGQ